ncbi:hypothetical protein [Streptomyces sp. NBC_00046]|uniref:hypothetical protein n=1 Tax=Streptomyces sp. NBC_00046 TaxID=2975626 RepID=UPI00324ABD75
MGISRTSALKCVRSAAVAAAMAGVVSVAGPASTASAGASCNNGCSQTWNDSGTGFYALKNWCKSGGGNGSWTTKKPTCGPDQKRDYLYPGDRTKGTQDWDVFQVDGGFCYDVDFEVTPPWGNDFHKAFDRRGKSTIWVKVANSGFAKVRDVSSKHC